MMNNIGMSVFVKIKLISKTTYLVQAQQKQQTKSVQFVITL